MRREHPHPDHIAFKRRGRPPAFVGLCPSQRRRFLCLTTCYQLPSRTFPFSSCGRADPRYYDPVQVFASRNHYFRGREPLAPFDPPEVLSLLREGQAALLVRRTRNGNEKTRHMPRFFVTEIDPPQPLPTSPLEKGRRFFPHYILLTTCYSHFYPSSPHSLATIHLLRLFPTCSPLPRPLLETETHRCRRPERSGRRGRWQTSHVAV